MRGRQNIWIGLILAVLSFACEEAYALKGSQYNDIYILLFATHNGKTGHIGLAIDNYEIHIKDGTNQQVLYDTVRTNTLTYYDLWPLQEDFDKTNVDAFVKAQYYKFPSASWQGSIRVADLYYRKISPGNDTPCDGLLKLTNSAAKDLSLHHHLDKIIEQNAPFHVRQNNCADFVENAIEFILGTDIKADEFIPFAFSTTPNRLFKCLVELKHSKMLKDPGKKVNGSFWQEKIIKGEIFEFSLQQKPKQ